MAVSHPTVDIPIQTDEYGTIRIGGTRVPLESVIASYQQGDTPERIHEGFPTLKLQDIYAVITYYLNHREDVDAYMRQQEEEGERIRQEIEAKRPDMFDLPKHIRERLTKRDA
jgi:uncharacterized protein (DUF433 family)